MTKNGPGLNVIKLFTIAIYEYSLSARVECLSLAGLSKQVKSLRTRPEPTLEWSTRKSIDLGKLQPYPKAFDYAGEAGQEKHSSLLQIFVNYDC